MISLVGRLRSRPLVILSLFSLLALVQAIAYFRYFRYLPFFSGIGLLFVFAAILPTASRTGLLLRSALERCPKTRMAGRARRRARGHARLLPSGAGASAGRHSGCGHSPMTATSRGLSATRAGLPAQPSWRRPIRHPDHVRSARRLRSWRSRSIRRPKAIERAYRFLDPQTADPQSVLAESRATHVALCAWRSAPLPGLAERYPLAAA